MEGGMGRLYRCGSADSLARSVIYSEKQPNAGRRDRRTWSACNSRSGGLSGGQPRTFSLEGYRRATVLLKIDNPMSRPQ